MQEIQKMEISEQPHENNMVKSISVSLKNKVENPTSPDMKTTLVENCTNFVLKSPDQLRANGIANNSINDVDEGEAFTLNGSVEELSGENTSEKSNTVAGEERDAGSDLDALLHKISSIVNVETKDAETSATTPETDSKKDNLDIVNENAGLDIKGNERPNELEKKISEEQQKEIMSSEVAVVEENEIQTNDKDSNSENLEEKTEEKKVEKDVLNDNKFDKEEESVKDREYPNDTSMRSSQDDIFVDALETISSSDDDFEVLDKQTNKIPSKTIDNTKGKIERKDKQENGLEDISSDDSIDAFDSNINKSSGPGITIIDLDSSDEVPKENYIANTNKKDMTLSPIPENENVEEEKINKDESHISENKPITDKDPDLADALNTEASEAELIEAVETYEASLVQSSKSDVEQEQETGSLKATSNDCSDAKQDTSLHDKEIIKESTQPQILENIRDENRLETVEAKSGEPIENDVKHTESDDEVIFFDPIPKGLEKVNEKTEDNKETQKQNIMAGKKEDEVVLVESEDEDENLTLNKTGESKASKEIEPVAQENYENLQLAISPHDSKSEEPIESGSLQADNSDNACDQFEKAKSDEKDKLSRIDENNSNSSSNLLRPSQNVSQQALAESTANTSEMIGDDVENEPDSDFLQAKRIKISTEHENSPSKEDDDCDADQQQQNRRVSIGCKRNRDSLDTSTTDTKEQTPNKKVKTDDSDSSNDGQLQIDLDSHDTTEESEMLQSKADHESRTNTASATPLTETVHGIKGETKVELSEAERSPFDLKPKPEFNGSPQPIRLEFLRHFGKSFDKMSRNDLEEMVLQKVIESMLVKSDFADLRRQIEKYESSMANYRRKIAELSKQFLDLETVHKRVLKDLEAKNAQFVTPVRITRAVGLQVGMSIRKPGDELRPATTGSTLPSNCPNVPPSAQTTKSGTARSPLRGLVPSASSGATQRPGPQTNLNSMRNPHGYGSNPVNYVPPVRRGCMQKITPQRPVNNGSTSVQQAMQGQQHLPSATSNQNSSIARTMHAAKHTASVSSAVASASVGRPRGTSVNAQSKKDGQQLCTAQKQQQQQMHQLHNPQRAGSIKLMPKATQKPRPMPPGGTVSVPISNSMVGSSAAVYGSPTLTPAKPKERTFIDLTDEDDAAAAASAASTTEARLKPTVAAGAKRSTASPASASVRPVAGSVVRVSPMDSGRKNAVIRQMVVTNSAGQRHSTASNLTMQIRSENTPPTPRLRYSHPAPLPSSPAQPFNPAWKLPPSRPVIRISLHDSGIVISWTLEDTSSRYATCCTYQIYAYQETIQEPCTDSWRHVGDVKAMLLPMAVTLNQFQENQRYYFAVRGVDEYQRYGAFSEPKTWS